MDKVTASERAMEAERAWSLAKQRGDDRLRAVALADYRKARREMRRQERAALARRLDEIRRGSRARVVPSEEYEAGSCNFTVSADPAGVAPSNVVVTFRSDAGFDPAKLTTKVTGATLPTPLGLSTNPQPVVSTSSLPVTLSSQFSWGTFAADGAGTPLVPSDGDGAPVFHTSFTITATP